MYLDDVYDTMKEKKKQRLAQKREQSAQQPSHARRRVAAPARCFLTNRRCNGFRWPPATSRLAAAREEEEEGGPASAALPRSCSREAPNRKLLVNFPRSDQKPFSLKMMLEIIPQSRRNDLEWVAGEGSL